MPIGDVKQRSPNYPGQPLGKSVEDVKLLYSKEGRTSFSLDTAAKGLGYSKGINGPARTRLSAVRQYGLIEQPKGGEAKITERALTLALRNQGSSEYKEAIQEAALEPPLFRAMFESKRIASAENLKHHLVLNERFTEEGADRFIDSYRQTMSLANLDEDGRITRRDEGQTIDELSEDEDEMDITHTPGRFVLSISGGAASFKVEHPLPLTEAIWNQIIAMVGAIKTSSRSRVDHKCCTGSAAATAAATDRCGKRFWRMTEEAVVRELAPTLRRSSGKRPSTATPIWSCLPAST